ncbi:hypothetical protein HON22_01140 [Candidatus Peregrinibacteria bacterium]|nr:hypothetical protein [Candidatus Peregrinibacteria bacterium]
MQETLAIGNNVLSILGGNPMVAANNDLYGAEPRVANGGRGWDFAGSVLEKLSGGAGKAVDKLSGGTGNVVNMLGSGLDKIRKERHEAKLARIERNPEGVRKSVKGQIVNFLGGGFEEKVEGLSEDAKEKMEFYKRVRKSTDIKSTLGNGKVSDSDYLKIFSLKGSDVEVKKINKGKVETENGKYEIPEGIRLEALQKALVIADDLGHNNNPVTLMKTGECMVEKGGYKYYIKPNGEVYSDYDIYKFKKGEGLNLREEAQESLNELNDIIKGKTLEEAGVVFNEYGEITEINEAITLTHHLPSSVEKIQQLNLLENSSFDKKFMKSLKDVSIKKLYYGEYKVVEDARFGEKMKRKTMGITRLPIYKYVDGEIINTYSTWKRFKGE